MYLTEKLPELESPLKLDDCALRRLRLIAALRAEVLPANHKWNYCNFPGCAVGLSDIVFGTNLVEIAHLSRGDEIHRQLLDMFGTTEPFFMGYSSRDNFHASDVTPKMVADRLEKEHLRILEKAARS